MSAIPASPRVFEMLVPSLIAILVPQSPEGSAGCAASRTPLQVYLGIFLTRHVQSRWGVGIFEFVRGQSAGNSEVVTIRVLATNREDSMLR